MAGCNFENSVAPYRLPLVGGNPEHSEHGANLYAFSTFSEFPLLPQAWVATLKTLNIVPPPHTPPVFSNRPGGNSENFAKGSDPDEFQSFQSFVCDPIAGGQL